MEAALADNGSLVARDRVHVMAATSCMPVLGGGLSRISPDVGSGKNGRLRPGVKNESAGVEGSTALVRVTQVCSVCMTKKALSSWLNGANNTCKYLVRSDFVPLPCKRG